MMLRFGELRKRRQANISGMHVWQLCSDLWTIERSWQLQESFGGRTMLSTAVMMFVVTVVGQAEDSLDAAEITTRLKKVQAERIETLEQAIEFANVRYRSGLVDIGVVVDIQPELIEAKLDVAASPEEQIRVLKEQLQIANELHAIARVKFEQGTSPSSELLRAKAAALRIKVQLLKHQHALATRDVGNSPTKPLAKVTGTITLNGRPLAGVTVTFVPDKGPVAAGVTDKVGRFAMTTYEENDGAALGRYRVKISDSIPEGDRRTEGDLPAKYADPDVSGLVVEVVQGSNVFNFDLVE
jgi:hypothetical protein